MLSICKVRVTCTALMCLLLLLPFVTEAQSMGNAGSISGTVTDSTGAVVPGATVEIQNPVSQYSRTSTSDNAGKFSFTNVPLNPYHMTVTATGFSAYRHDVEVRSTVPITLDVALAVGASNQVVTVEGDAGDLVETDSTFHSDVDRGMFDKLPLESTSSALSSLVTLASPGVAADSNGQIHSLGEHADTSVSLDGQPITDQQSKNFSNQLPVDAVQSMEVISGAPPAQYGDKTSLVMDVTTRSGLGITTPHGAITTSYGSFGTGNVDFNFAYGGKNWGNFVTASGLRTGRFLDPPEFEVMHAIGNEENIFDRADYQLTTGDALHMNIALTRSWFQNPNSYDNLHVGGTDPFGNPLPATDQRAQIRTFNIAPTWTHTFGASALLTSGLWVRHDQYNYYPSNDPFADISPIQSESVGQDRRLTNAGARTDLSYTKGIHNVKVGATYMQTFLLEDDRLGIIDPTVNPLCLNADGSPNTNPAVASVGQCGGALNIGGTANPNFLPILLPYDLTRGGSYYTFRGHTDVKELGLYAQDAISVGNWNFNLGIRDDLYNGLSVDSLAEPRLGMAYNIKITSTVLRASYARTMNTPYNENLVLSNNGCFDAVIAALVPCVPASLNPGHRNEYHVGFQQAFGRRVVVSGEYIWKYTSPDYDFSILGNTPIFFPIEWTKSKIPGWALKTNIPNWHGFTAQINISSVAARFFPPQSGGLGVTVGQNGLPFRIDHDEKFNQTTHLQYQPWKKGPWFGFNWRSDSGLVAGSAPCYGVLPQNNCPTSTMLNGQPAIDLSGFSADQEFQAGFFCGSVRATPFAPLPTPCPLASFGSTLISIPAPNAQNDDKNPARISSRNVFDMAVGIDNILKGDKYKVSLQLSAVNVTNQYALYNFLSTFSGTHYLTPRSISGELGFHF